MFSRILFWSTVAILWAGFMLCLTFINARLLILTGNVALYQTINIVVLVTKYFSILSYVTIFVPRIEKTMILFFKRVLCI